VIQIQNFLCHGLTDEVIFRVLHEFDLPFLGWKSGVECLTQCTNEAFVQFQKAIRVLIVDPTLSLESFRKCYEGDEKVILGCVQGIVASIQAEPWQGCYVLEPILNQVQMLSERFMKGEPKQLETLYEMVRLLDVELLRKAFYWDDDPDLKVKIISWWKYRNDIVVQKVNH
jgi:hypothetical protein